MASVSGEQRQMRLTGVHHLTGVVRDAERTIAFYRDLLGLRVVRDGPSDDDRTARHVWLSTGDGGAGTLVSFMEYPSLPEATAGIGGVQHFALVVESAEELAVWRDYLRHRGVACTDVMERGGFASIYVRDPDQHIVEIATRGPGVP